MPRIRAFRKYADLLPPKPVAKPAEKPVSKSVPEPSTQPKDKEKKDAAKSKKAPANSPAKNVKTSGNLQDLEEFKQAAA